MRAPDEGAGRRAAVMAALATVNDPELDESVVDLGFIEEVAFDAEHGVDIGFRLPTYWCSPNFAYLMAADIVAAVGAVEGMRAVRPHLRDHMASDEVNRGAAEGLSFADAFARFEVSGTLDALREKFRCKAFQRRQEAVLAALVRAGLDMR